MSYQTVLKVSPLLLISSPQVLEAHSKVSTEHSLLQAKQAHLPQPLFLKEVLQPSEHPFGSSLDPLQQVSIFPVPGPPSLDTEVCTRNSTAQPPQEHKAEGSFALYRQELNFQGWLLGRISVPTWSSSAAAQLLHLIWQCGNGAVEIKPSLRTGTRLSLKGPCQNMLSEQAQHIYY